MALVALAHLYVTLPRRELREDAPVLMLDLAMLLLRSALPRLTQDQAVRLVEYYLHSSFHGLRYS